MARVESRVAGRTICPASSAAVGRELLAHGAIPGDRVTEIVAQAGAVEKRRE